MQHRRLSVALLAIALATTGCIGSIDRADFDAEVRSRGGGITTQWITEGIDLAAAEVGVTDRAELAIMSLRVNSTDRVLVATARRNDQPEFVDTVVVREGDVVSVTPIQDADRLPLDDITILIADLPIDDLESISDQALEEFGDTDSFVDAIAFNLVDGEPAVDVYVESSRRTGTVRFDADGNFVEVVR